MAESFHELRGEYVDHGGQQMNLPEYLDYFEPLGSALARLPDGTGGPFVHSFTVSGGRTIGSLGWVRNASAARRGAWKLWGAWSDRPIPPIALPLFWPVLEDPGRMSDWIGRANDHADRLLDPGQWDALLKDVKATRLREAPFREYLKAELSRAYAIPLPHRHPIEVELTPRMLDLLPWLYLLGPVDPLQAHVQPNRFNGIGYQYILSDELPAVHDAEISREVDSIVDKASTNVAAGWRLANELRERRTQPPAKRREARAPKERKEMPATQTSSRKPPEPMLWEQIRSVATTAWTPVFQVIVLLLLAWIAWNVWVIRKAVTVKPVVEPAVVTDTQPDVAPVYEPDLSRTRLRRIATALRQQRTYRVNDAVLDEVSAGGTEAANKLARASVEIFLRRNGCFTPRTDPVDGKFSTAEQRAIRNCSLLQDERLMKDGNDPDTARAIDWLERNM